MTANHHRKTTKPFTVWDADVSVLTGADLRQEMDTHGYLLIRGLLSPMELMPLLADVTAVLHRAAWLKAGRDPCDRLANRAAAATTGTIHPRHRMT